MSENLQKMFIEDAPQDVDNLTFLFLLSIDIYTIKSYILSRK